MAQTPAADPTTPAHDACPASLVFDLIAHKWTLAIMHHLQVAEAPVRFRQLQRMVGAITPKELTKRLRELERAGLADRTIFAEIPPRVEYRLTDLGATLIPALVGLDEWSNDHADQVIANRQRFDGTRADQANAGSPSR